MMSSLRLTLMIRMFVALCLAAGLALAPPLNVIAHGSAAVLAEDGRHAALAPGETVDDHGHSHDDDHGDQTRSGHLHGHDTSDHSHDTATPLRWLALDRPPSPRQVGAALVLAPDPGPTFRLDRPPRLSS